MVNGNVKSSCRSFYGLENEDNFYDLKTISMTWSMNMRMMTMMMMPQVTERVPASEEFFRRRMLLQTDLGLS